jgi:N-acetylglucosaminyl-diphospho-decaprenol L-rhamnosyltransferase
VSGRDRRRVAVITVAFRSVGVIDGLLSSVPGATRRDVEVVVVDNSPEDDGLAARLDGRPDTRLLIARDNPGYGGGINRGAALLGPDVDWIVVANPDLTIAPDAIDHLIDAAERLPDAGSLGPLIRDANGDPYPSARNIPSLRTGIGHAAFVRVWPGNPWTQRYRNDHEIRERSAGWLSGAFVLLPRRVFDELGGFDDRYFMYFEDVDLGRRISRAGWRNYYIPRAEVTHVGALSTRYAARPMIVAHHRSAYRFLAAKYHGWYLWPLRVALRVALWARGRVARG